MNYMVVDSSISMMSVLLLWMGSGMAVETNSSFSGFATNLTHKVSTSRVLLDFYVQCLFYLALCRLSALEFKRSASKDCIPFFTAAS